jgi:hypothetical protein
MIVDRDWANIDRIRVAVSQSLLAVFGDLESRDAVAMVTAELLENAIKYAAPHARTVRVAVYDMSREIVVAVSNDVGDDALDGLRRRVDWVRGFGSGEDAYLAAICEAYQGGDEGAGATGCLGLARVVYEGGCELQLEEQGGRVTVRASRRMEQALLELRA